MKARFRPNAGFTLIEVMTVIFIIAIVMGLGARRLFDSTTAMRSGIRKLAIMTRDLRNQARLTGSTMRFAIQLDEPQKNQKGQVYSIESAPGNVTLLSEELRQELEKKTSIQREDEKPKEAFSADTRILKKPEKLPRGLYFESVELASRKEPLVEGKAYIHFFPQGLAEEAVIHLTDHKTLNWTIAINPLTGRATVYERKLTLKEIRGP